MEIIIFIIVSALAGYVATKVMERVSIYMYNHENVEARKVEESLRIDDPTTALTKKIIQWLNIHMSERRIGFWSTSIHYSTGLGGGVAAGILVILGIEPISAGLIVGLSMTIFFRRRIKLHS